MNRQFKLRKTGVILLGVCLLALAPASAVGIGSDYENTGPQSVLLNALVNQPDPLAGWAHKPDLSQVRYSLDTPKGHGIPLSGADVVRSSPTIAEVDGNTANGNEVVVGGNDGRLYTYHADGSLAWSADVMPGACSVVNDGKLNGAAAVGDLYGDGVPYVVVGYGTINPSDCDGGIAVYRGSTGALAWRFSLRAWGQTQPAYSETMFGVASSPALADVDGDGKMEIGFGAFDRHVYLLNADGSVRWYYHTADTVWSSPAFYDVNNDGRLDMVIGSDITSNPNIGTPDGGYMYALDTAPRVPPWKEFCSPLPQYYYTCDNTFQIWRMEFDQTIYSSPVVADVLPNNPGPEIIIGSGYWFPRPLIGQDESTITKRGAWVKILRPSDGQVLQTLNTPACLSSSVAVGDLDDDGKLEIVATVMGAYGGGDSVVMAWNPETATEMWRTAPRDAWAGDNDKYGADLQSPVIADIDGNGSLEVLVSNWWAVHVLNGRTGAALVCQGPLANCGEGSKTLRTWDTVKSTPAIGDINGDGVLDVVIGSGNINTATEHGWLYAWTNVNLGSPAGSQAPYSAPWPMFRGDPTHSGVLGANSAFHVPVENLLQLIEPGSTMTTTIAVRRSKNALWTVQKDSDPNGILTLLTEHGIGNSEMSFRISAPLSLGTYVATLSVHTAEFSSETMTVTTKVVNQVFQMEMPYTQR
ncbi:MAG: hypothetical protein NTZ50_05670 [Chloroflexi bacterium]|nr:hypothetical protein [Chloroflexota bacterium]